MKEYRKLFGLFILLLISNLGLAQKTTNTKKREKTWIYDVNIIKDGTGKIYLEKVVFGKGTPGGPIQIRYFETKEQIGLGGYVIYSTRERVGENNVDPNIIKQAETLPVTDKNKKKK